MLKIALTIAGSDPSGGAGIQADLKVFSAFGVYGMAVPAALTAQSTSGVAAAKAVSPAFLQAQLETLLSDVQPDAVKTGMLLSAAAISTVAAMLPAFQVKNLVIDPVMVSSSGKRLLRKNAVSALVNELFPLAELVMPNKDEAEVLSGMRIETREDAKEAARIIQGLGPRFVLVKGGHLPGDATDLFYNGSEFFEYVGRRVQDKKLHGAGCAFSAAVTAGLAKGLSAMEAIAEAKDFINKTIRKAVPVGKGRVPLV